MSFPKKFAKMLFKVIGSILALILIALIALIAIAAASGAAALYLIAFEQTF